MGAVFNYRIYPDKDGREKIRQDWLTECDMSLYEHGHSYSGEIGMLKGSPSAWLDKKLPSCSDASEFISGKHGKWEPPIAVSFIDQKGEKYWVIGGWCSS